MTSTPKVDPAAMSPLARRRVRRVAPRTLMVLLGGGALLICSSVFLALGPSTKRKVDMGRELINTNVAPSADGLATLPKDYAGMVKPTPQLGPPLPGDFGRPLLRQQGLASGAAVEAAIGKPARDQAELDAQAALSSKIFFPVAGRGDAPEAAHAQPRLPESIARPVLAPADNEFVQNMQSQKRAFVENGDDTRSAYRLEQPRSPFELRAGTVIELALAGGVTSDLPGTVRAQVLANIFDSGAGRFCLVPQGTMALGTYNSQLSYGQDRVQLVFTRLIRPDSSSIRLDRLQAVDPAGLAGLEDEVDHHWGRIAGAALVSAVLNVGAEVGADTDDRLVQALRRSEQTASTSAGQQLVRRGLNMQPTNTLRPGLPLRVVLTKDIELPPVRGDQGDATCRN